MRKRLLLLPAVLLALSLSAQETVKTDSTSTDTLQTAPTFSPGEAWEYVDHVVHTNALWKTPEDSVREALQRLLDHSVEPFDSVRARLLLEDFSGTEVEKGNSMKTGSLAVRWLNDSTFLVDPHGWSPSLYMKNEEHILIPEDTSLNLEEKAPPDPETVPDSGMQAASPRLMPDTIRVQVIDTSALEALGISMHTLTAAGMYPPLDSGNRTGRLSADRARVIYYRPGFTWNAPVDSPFRVLEGEHQLDSLQHAVDRLLEYTLDRDSTILWINDMRGHLSPLWLTQGKEGASRFWVKNFSNDSITIWVGNPAPHEISLLLEEDVNINRLKMETVSDLGEFVKLPGRSLASVAKLNPEPIYWDHSISSVFSMNQTYLSNWSKGGESSFSTMIDVLGEATYNNKEARTQWISTMRINFGTLSTRENGFRKNNDLFEINSKFNGNAWGKIGMSASFYMKNQLAKGYNYPNDSVVVSKFLNPATLTLGLGFEYKPFKNMTLNVAPLSYKNTFVLDTAHIDQTKHGIEKGKKSKQELGTQLVLISKMAPYRDLSIENRLRLFSSYLNNPQNVDVDWEVIMDQKINWFFTIRLNLHLVYDDDIRFPVLNSEGEPIILPDGSEYKVAKAQFKEFIGLSLQFKF